MCSAVSSSARVLRSSRASASSPASRSFGRLQTCTGFWRDFQNLPRFMPHLSSVRVDTAWQSHWVAQGPAGTTVEWDAEITDDRPDALIAWRSLAGADLDHAG